MHGPTYMGNPLACAVASASLDLLTGSDWQANVARLQAGLADGLAPCRDVPGVREVRTLGAVGVVELDHPVDVVKATDAALEHGVWIRPFRNLIYTMPPYVTDDADLATICTALHAAAIGMTGSWDDWFAEKAAAREAAGLVRRLVPHGPDETVLDLAGNDYLGLSRHPQVRAAAAEAATLWGAGAGASRLVTGTLSLHDDLERELAAFLGWPAALVTSTGYHANLAVVTALVDRTALIVSDAHIHASLIDAARLSRAEVVVTPHNDVAAVRAALAGRRRPAGAGAGRVGLLRAR